MSPSSNTQASPHPEPIRATLELFEGPLAQVCFPGVDQSTLATAAREVEARQVELQRTLEAVQVARAALEAGQQQLEEQARRAHAYAAVFAQDDPPLAAKLAAIKFDGRALAPKKKRGRPRKSSSAAKTGEAAGPAPGKTQTSLSVAEDAA